MPSRYQHAEPCRLLVSYNPCSCNRACKLNLKDPTNPPARPLCMATLNLPMLPQPSRSAPRAWRPCSNPQPRQSPPQPLGRPSTTNTSSSRHLCGQATRQPWSRVTLAGRGRQLQRARLARPMGAPSPRSVPRSQQGEWPLLVSLGDMGCCICWYRWSRCCYCCCCWFHPADLEHTLLLASSAATANLAPVQSQPCFPSLSLTLSPSTSPSPSPSPPLPLSLLPSHPPVLSPCPSSPCPSWPWQPGGHGAGDKQPPGAVVLQPGAVSNRGVQAPGCGGRSAGR